MDLSAIAAGQDLVSFILGAIIASIPLYNHLVKNQIIPKELQKEIQKIISTAEELENGYTSDDAQELGEAIIRVIAEYNEAAAKAAGK